ncbi:energy-coupling factor transport system substrate-specific component [Brevibacterium iodinum ATCC 49514]|uniref:Energy-coupling factor transport system substrate-specific component n=1 Tax=Brevibacterium iodinum ATCC 49514 TaxID=1255616 RepID=A0A2H1JTI1_9MICO|nr:ECF transporter S component [Brevibacterium iodinum]SMX90810.1 energy-coupling factor transport system substrate-specific component [Brevibacterium iodinum ATCC 49514]SUW12418.1 Uncharacterised protein [Brevibacterium iodinum]
MNRQPGDDSHTEDTFDSLVGDLRTLRVNAGVLPYAEIARRIGRHRGQINGDGVTDAPARSTVYDAFRLGRSRLNAELVGEIVRALGEDEHSIQQWKIRCYRVQSTAEHDCERELVRVENHVESNTETEPAKPHRPRYIYVGAVMLLCALLNALGYALVGELHLALYLDMVGTATGAILLGPWCGVAIAILGNAFGILIHGPMALVFALVNVAGALVWGYGVRRPAWTATFTQFFRLNLLVAAVCTLVAVPLLMFGYHGGTGHESDQLTYTFTASGQNLLSAVLLSNGITSILDKLATGFIALAVIHACTSRIKAVDPDFSSPADNFLRFDLHSTIRRLSPVRIYSAVQARMPRTRTNHA